MRAVLWRAMWSFLEGVPSESSTCLLYVRLWKESGHDSSTLSYQRSFIWDYLEDSNILSSYTLFFREFLLRNQYFFSLYFRR